MTVEARVPKEFYEGNGATKTWPFYFPAMSESHVKVGVSRSDAGTDWLDPELYEVDLAAGNVVYPLLGEALPKGKWIVIIRETPIEQNLDLENVGNFYPESIEKSLDYRAFVEQEIKEKLNRAVMVPPWVKDPGEYGQGVMNATERAEKAAANAEQSQIDAKKEAEKAAGSADESKTAQKGSEKAQSESEAAAKRAEEAMKNKLEPQDLIAGNNVVIEESEDGKLTISSTAGEESGTVTSVETIRPDKFGNVDLIEVNNEKRGLMTPIAKMKLDSLPEIPKPTDEDRGKTLVYKDDGSLAWEFNVVHHIGEIFAFGGSTPPVGAVECRGQAMSKTTHPDLFEAIGYNFGGSGDSFYLPDTYSAARFLRSRSSSLPIGTEQEDAIRNIKGTVRSGLSTQSGSTQATGAFIDSYFGNSTTLMYQLTGGTAKDMYASFDASKVVPTAEENRPVNLSIMYCIQVTHGYVNPSEIDVASLQLEVIKLRNKEQYPPMFIQGFLIEYITSSSVIVKSGSCRSIDNKFNIDLSMDYMVNVSSTVNNTVHFFAVLHVDDSVSIETYISNLTVTPNPPKFDNEKARRRIGSLFWLQSQNGFPIFISRENEKSLEVMYSSSIIKNLSTAAAYSNLALVVTVPNGIKVDAYMRLLATGTNVTASIGNYWSGLTIMQFSGAPLSATYKHDFIPLEGEAKVRFTCSGSGFSVDVSTCGFKDWRID